MVKSSTSCQYYLKAAVLYFFINVIGSLFHPPRLIRISAKWDVKIDGEIAQFIREIALIIGMARGLVGKGENRTATHADIFRRVSGGGRSEA